MPPSLTSAPVRAIPVILLTLDVQAQFQRSGQAGLFRPCANSPDKRRNRPKGSGAAHPHLAGARFVHRRAAAVGQKDLVK